MLTADQLAAWDRDGYLVFEDAVDSATCDELREHVIAQLAAADPTVDGGLTVFDTTEQGHAQQEYFLTSGDKVRWFLEDGAVSDGQLTRPLPLAVNKLAHAMHDLDPVFDRFSRTPLMAEIAADLGVVDPKLLQSMYIFKQPSIGGEVSCHCDHTFLWTEPQSVIGYWFAIEDATVENGCLYVAPGRHRDPVRTRLRREGDGTTMDVLDTTPWPTDELVPIEATKGTMLVLHGSLPHWSAPNTSATSRHAYTLHVIDGTADYPDDNWLRRAPDMPLRGFT
ncbi:MAG: phytanoyl-CoA dioxygenase family protein [Acidimicrobiales bacterium]|nr:phytanoyl-CoA dioxygenase family protein [Acidimicrobiales bacterium]